MDIRDWFQSAAAGCREIVAAIGPDELDLPGLGEWDVRALLGHTSRSFLTIETYLDPTVTQPPQLHGPAAYFNAALTGSATDPAAVSERGRAAGAALGDDPSGTFEEIAQRVTALVDASPAATVCTTPFGTMTLIDYLPTRAFELTVHGLDLARATGRTPPEELIASVVPAVRLCAELADPLQRVAILLALTGRVPLPAEFTLL